MIYHLCKFDRLDKIAAAAVAVVVVAAVLLLLLLLQLVQGACFVSRRRDKPTALRIIKHAKTKTEKSGLLPKFLVPFSVPGSFSSFEAANRWICNGV